MSRNGNQAGQEKNKSLCKECGRVVTIGEWPYCPHGIPASTKPYTGRKFWTGTEAYGTKKLLSDEHRVDVEAAMSRGGG